MRSEWTTFYKAAPNDPDVPAPAATSTVAGTVSSSRVSTGSAASSSRASTGSAASSSRTPAAASASSSHALAAASGAARGSASGRHSAQRAACQVRIRAELDSLPPLIGSFSLRRRRCSPQSQTASRELIKTSSTRTSRLHLSPASTTRSSTGISS